MGGACGAYGEGRGVHRVLVGKPEGKIPLGRPRCRCEGNIKMDLQEEGGGCEDWMELAQDRDRWWALVSTVMNLRVPKMLGISWLAAEPVSFSRRTLLHGVSKDIGLDSFLLTDVSILGDSKVTSLIITGGAPTGFGCHWLGTMHKIIRSRLDGFRTRQNLAR